MLLAKYRDDNSECIIKIEEIPSRRQYLENYEGKLFCTGENCSARLGFVEGQLSGRRNSFRTIRGDIHISGCDNEIDRSQDRAPRRGGNVVMTTIKKEHARSVLKRARDKSKGIKPKSRYDIRRKTKSKLIDNELEIDNSPTIVSTVDPSIEPVEHDGTRSAPIRDKHCNDILPEDIGYTICLRGYFKEIIVSEAIINIVFESELEKPIYMEFYTPFKENNKQIFELMQKFTETAKIYEVGSTVLFGLGLLVEREKAYILEMYNATDFYFDDDNAYEIIKKINSLQKSITSI